MIKNYEIIRYIDKYRVENKIPIYQLTKGIMSTRNYSRLLPGESVLSFEDYSALLKRLRMPLFEFAMYLYNCLFFEYIHESNFLNAVDDKLYKEAYDIISPYLSEQRWGFIFSEKTLPMAIKFVEYKLNKCSLSELLAYSRDIININQIMNYSILSLDDFEAIFMFSGFCSIEEKRLISKFLTRVILEGEVKILNGSVEHTTSRLHRLAIQVMTSFDDHDDHDLLNLKKIANIALEYQSRAKIYGEDLNILESLYRFYKRSNMESKPLLTEFVLSALSAKDDYGIKKLKELLSNQEIEYILDLISKSELKKSNLFEEVLYGETI